MKRTMKNRIAYWGEITEPVKRELADALTAFEISYRQAAENGWERASVEVGFYQRLGDLINLGGIDDVTAEEARKAMRALKEAIETSGN